MATPTGYETNESGYSNTDLASIFQSGISNIETGYKLSTGADIGNSFALLTGPTKANTVGYYTKIYTNPSYDVFDLSQIFEPIPAITITIINGNYNEEIVTIDNVSYNVVTFNTSGGDYLITANKSININQLFLVGGGGGSPYYPTYLGSSGGNGGQVLYTANDPLSQPIQISKNDSINITIGNGGSSVPPYLGPGNTVSTSTISSLTLTAIGGGGASGGANPRDPLTNGSDGMDGTENKFTSLFYGGGGGGGASSSTSYDDAGGGGGGGGYGGKGGTPRSNDYAGGNGGGNVGMVGGSGGARFDDGVSNKNGGGGGGGSGGTVGDAGKGGDGGTGGGAGGNSGGSEGSGGGGGGAGGFGGGGGGAGGVAGGSGGGGGGSGGCGCAIFVYTLS